MKYGFIYIWKDKKHKKFYIGSHWGIDNDGYICSSKKMRDNYRNRPTTFCRRILKKVYTNRKDLIQEEQRWLNMIKPEEFSIKYYNINAKANGWCWWMNEETRKIVSEKLSLAGKEGKYPGTFQKGRLPTQKQKEQRIKTMRKNRTLNFFHEMPHRSAIHKCPTCGKEGKGIVMYRHHFGKCKNG